MGFWRKTKKDRTPNTDELIKVRSELKNLIESNPSEETIHNYLFSRPEIFGRKNKIFISKVIVEGIISKFPITPDRIPDITIARLEIRRTQHPHFIKIVELKKPDSKVFVNHNRMSKDLNDAWMECIEASRLIGLNFQDYLRRIILNISGKKKVVQKFEKEMFNTDYLERIH